MHALDLHCFHLFLCSSKLFQIPPECMLKRNCLCVKNKTIKLRNLWPNPLLPMTCKTLQYYIPEQKILIQ